MNFLLHPIRSSIVCLSLALVIGPGSGDAFAQPLSGRAQRNVVPMQALEPADVFLVNSTGRELLVEIHDQFTGGPPVEHRIPPGGAVRQRLAREAGALVEETRLVPDFYGGWFERSRRYQVPAQPRYSVDVSGYETTYRYIDRVRDLRPSPLPDFDLQTPVTIGSFLLPPGDVLRDGEQIDVYREALRSRTAAYPPMWP